MSEVSVARARSSDPVTSFEAADSVVDVTLVQARIFGIVQRFGPVDDHEIAWHYGHEAVKNDWVVPSPSSLRTRRRELEDQNHIEFSGVYGLSPSKRRTQKWVAA